MKKVVFTFNNYPKLGRNVVEKDFPDDVSIEEIQKSAKEMALEYVNWYFSISDVESGEGDAR